MANFNPDNRRVQLYGDEGTTTIEKNLEGIFGEVIKNPTAFKKTFEGLIKSNVELEKRNLELFKKNQKLGQDKTTAISDLIIEKKARRDEKALLEAQIASKEGVLVEFSKSIQELRDYQERIFRVLGADVSNPGTYHIKVIEDMYKFLHTHTTDWYKFTYDGNLYKVANKPGEQRLFPIISYYGTPKNGISVKDFTDTSTALVKKYSIDINGKVHEFVADNLPRHFNLKEMFDEITDLRIGLQEVWDTTLVNSINDIKTYLNIDGADRGVKFVRERGDVFRRMLDDVIGLTSPGGIKLKDNELVEAIRKIVAERKQFIKMVNDATIILNAMEERICDKLTWILRRTALVGRKSIKKEVKKWFDDLHTVMDWTRLASIKWEDPEK